MFKSHTPFRMALLTACFLPATQLSADVLSSVTTPDLVEPAGIYDSSAPNLLNMRVKTVIGSGACVAGTYDGCTLNDVLNDIDGSDDFKPEIKVHMTADDFPDDGLVSNAELRQRGATSRGAPQKSFRVKLDSKDDLWRGERRIQLVKSFWDFSRIRNKLSYDLFANIPNLPSMQTQFVNFKVEDQGNVEDYGLYTHVEYFGKEYLVQRGWDKDSGVYKAENFFFRDDPAFALDANGEPVDEDAFEKLMEIKRGEDHTKFVEMLQALNNPSLDFNSQVFNKYFNKDNYISWLAVNLLLDNYDTNFHNFYLYNPKDTEKFYMVPWDYDLGLGASFDNNASERTDLPRWTQSHANWWGQELHQQFLRQPGNLDLLKDAMEEIKDKYMTPAIIQQKADSYYNVAFPLITSSPDIDTLYVGGADPEKVAAYNRIFSSLAAKVQLNYEQFYNHMGDPMPFGLKDPDASGSGYKFEWSASESLTGQTIRYDLEVSTTATFDSGTIVHSENGIQGTSKTVSWAYPSGNYFYRIIARDANAPSQYWQAGYNEVKLDNGQAVYGVVGFYAQNNGGSTAPVGNPDFASTEEGTATVISVLSNDIGSGLYISTSTSQWSEKGGRVFASNNQINYTPKSGFTGTDRLWYNIKDSQGRENYSVVTITVSDSAYPAANPDTVSTTINTGITIDVLANDTGNGLNLTSSNPWSLNGGRVSISNNRIVYIPKSGFTGEDRLWYVFEDSRGRTNSSRVTINVGGEPEYPVAYSDSITTIAYTPVTIDAVANDTGAGLYIIDANQYSANGGQIVVVDGKLRYTPRDGYRGTDSFWYAIRDSLGRDNSAKVTVTVY